MTDPTDLTRRTMLTLGSVGAVGSALALAGCATDAPEDGATPTTTPSRTPTPTPTDEPAAEPTTAPDAPPVGEDITALADVPVGGSIDATIKGQPALIAQPTAGQVVAFSAICTHQQCVVAAAGAQFDCPCHGSRYDAATGDVLNGPALEPLSSIPVAVSGDRIVATS